MLFVARILLVSARRSLSCSCFLSRRYGSCGGVGVHDGCFAIAECSDCFESRNICCNVFICCCIAGASEFLSCGVVWCCCSFDGECSVCVVVCSVGVGVVFELSGRWNVLLWVMAVVDVVCSSSCDNSWYSNFVPCGI